MLLLKSYSGRKRKKISSFRPKYFFDYNYYLYLCNSKLGMMWIILSFLPGYNNLS